MRVGSCFTMAGPSEQLCRRPTGVHASGQQYPRSEAFSGLFQKGSGPVMIPSLESLELSLSPGKGSRIELTHEPTLPSSARCNIGQLCGVPYTNVTTNAGNGHEHRKPSTSKETSSQVVRNYFWRVRNYFWRVRNCFGTFDTTCCFGAFETTLTNRIVCTDLSQLLKL